MGQNTSNEIFSSDDDMIMKLPKDIQGKIVNNLSDIKSVDTFFASYSDLKDRLKEYVKFYCNENEANINLKNPVNIDKITNFTNLQYTNLFFKANNYIEIDNLMSMTKLNNFNILLKTDLEDLLFKKSMFSIGNFYEGLYTYNGHQLEQNYYLKFNSKLNYIDDDYYSNVFNKKEDIFVKICINIINLFLKYHNVYFSNKQEEMTTIRIHSEKSNYLFFYSNGLLQINNENMEYTFDIWRHMEKKGFHLRGFDISETILTGDNRIRLCAFYERKRCNKEKNYILDKHIIDKTKQNIDSNNCIYRNLDTIVVSYDKIFSLQTIEPTSTFADVSCLMATLAEVYFVNNIIIKGKPISSFMDDLYKHDGVIYALKKSLLRIMPTNVPVKISMVDCVDEKYMSGVIESLSKIFTNITDFYVTPLQKYNNINFDQYPDNFSQYPHTKFYFDTKIYHKMLNGTIKTIYPEKVSSLYHHIGEINDSLNQFFPIKNTPLD